MIEINIWFMRELLLVCHSALLVKHMVYILYGGKTPVNFYVRLISEQNSGSAQTLSEKQEEAMAHQSS